MLGPSPHDSSRRHGARSGARQGPSRRPARSRWRAALDPVYDRYLIGIGETRRSASMAARRHPELHERYGHIQEVIVQNFRANLRIPMRDAAEPRSKTSRAPLRSHGLVLGPDGEHPGTANCRPTPIPVVVAGLTTGRISRVTSTTSTRGPWPAIRSSIRRPRPPASPARSGWRSIRIRDIVQSSSTSRCATHRGIIDASGHVRSRMNTGGTGDNSAHR